MSSRAAAGRKQLSKPTKGKSAAPGNGLDFSPTNGFGTVYPYPAANPYPPTPLFTQLPGSPSVLMYTPQGSRPSTVSSSSPPTSTYGANRMYNANGNNPQFNYKISSTGSLTANTSRTGVDSPYAGSYGSSPSSSNTLLSHSPSPYPDLRSQSSFSSFENTTGKDVYSQSSPYGYETPESRTPPHQGKYGSRDYPPSSSPHPHLSSPTAHAHGRWDYEYLPSPPASAGLLLAPRGGVSLSPSPSPSPVPSTSSRSSPVPVPRSYQTNSTVQSQVRSSSSSPLGHWGSSSSPGPGSVMSLGYRTPVNAEDDIAAAYDGVLYSPQTPSSPMPSSSRVLNGQQGYGQPSSSNYLHVPPPLSPPPPSIKSSISSSSGTPTTFVFPNSRSKAVPKKKFKDSDGEESPRKFRFGKKDKDKDKGKGKGVDTSSSSGSGADRESWRSGESPPTRPTIKSPSPVPPTPPVPNSAPAAFVFPSSRSRSSPKKVKPPRSPSDGNVTKKFMGLSLGKERRRGKRGSFGKRGSEVEGSNFESIPENETIGSIPGIDGISPTEARAYAEEYQRHEQEYDHASMSSQDGPALLRRRHSKESMVIPMEFDDRHLPRPGPSPGPASRDRRRDAMFQQNGKMFQYMLDPYDSGLLESDRQTHSLLSLLSPNNDPSFYPYSNSPPATILDLGCGQGHWALDAANKWAGYGVKVTGVDSVDLCSRRFASAVRKGTEGMSVEFVKCNFLAGPLPFPDASFDLVRLSCLTMAIPYEKWETLFKEVNRVLSVGGRVELVDDHIFFPYPSSSATALDEPSAWNDQSSTSHELEALFENMLTVKYGIHLCPSQFLQEIMERTFGFARELDPMHLTLAPPDEPDSRLRQSPGLVLWPSTFIPLPPGDVEAHAMRHTKTLLACKAQLMEYAKEINQNSGEPQDEGDNVIDVEGVMEALYEYEEFLQDRFDPPTSANTAPPNAPPSDPELGSGFDSDSETLADHGRPARANLRRGMSVRSVDTAMIDYQSDLEDHFTWPGGKDEPDPHRQVSTQTASASSSTSESLRTTAPRLTSPTSGTGSPPGYARCEPIHIRTIHVFEAIKMGDGMQ